MLADYLSLSCACSQSHTGCYTYAKSDILAKGLERTNPTTWERNSDTKEDVATYDSVDELARNDRLIKCGE
jgi:hypothetical protein